MYEALLALEATKAMSRLACCCFSGDTLRLTLSLFLPSNGKGAVCTRRAPTVIAPKTEKMSIRRIIDQAGLLDLRCTICWSQRDGEESFVLLGGGMVPDR